MSSPGVGGSLSAASDVYFNNPVQDNTLKYDSSLHVWRNGAPPTGATGPTGPTGPASTVPGPTGATGAAGANTIAALPAGCVISTSTTTRPTARTDIVVLWTGADPGGAAVNGDVWLGAP